MIDGRVGVLLHDSNMKIIQVLMIISPVRARATKRVPFVLAQREHLSKRVAVDEPFTHPAHDATTRGGRSVVG